MTRSDGQKKYRESSSDLRIFERLFLQARPYWKHLLLILVLELVAVPITLLLPLPVKVAVDNVIAAKPLPGFLQSVIPAAVAGSRMSLLWFAVLLQIAVVFLMHLQFMLSYVLQTYTGEKLTLSFKQRLFRHVQRLSFSFHDQRGTADSIYRIQYDAPNIQYITINGIIPLISAVLKLVGMIGVIALINLRLALVALSITPFLFALARDYNKRMRPKYGDIKVLESNVLSIVQEVLTSFRVVKAFGREKSEQDRFFRESNETVKKKVHLSWTEGIFSILINLTIGIGTAAIIFIGVTQVMANAITLGELLMVLTYLTQLYAPLQEISAQASKFQYFLASSHRAFELLDELPEVIEKPHAKPLKSCQGGLEYQDVSFAYDQKNVVLKNVSLRVPAGARVGITGKTGAGKSTLVSLMPRFYDPISGTILLDGTDIRDYKLTDLRNQFSIVLQEPVLFSTSIAENILYAKPGATRVDMIEAAKAANAHDFISRLPQQYDTLVGERGMRLSGGERQRISLARAFLKNAPILLLDEPTSSVDRNTEQLIMEAMERLMKNRTTFMIAHRIGTLDTCDIRLEVKDGCVQIIPTPVSSEN